ncbi:MAG: cation:proton antiporter [Oscillospiraceae bacterium]|jgi:NhaP-type Na+/H+ or K+/H+ antiporter|nr:cation:proton antiporter [Oscillospiraceae bacterium]
MLFSLALMIICALVLSGILQKLKLPGLVGMLLTGIILGPYTLDLIAPELLNISADLREIALIVILVRAGLALDMEDLRKVGRPAVLMCFIPATFEIIAATVLAPLFFPVTHLEAAIMGTVLGAVSPAVVVPRMLKIMESGYGKDKAIPQLIMAGASADDVYVIVLFTSFMSMNGGGGFDAGSLVKVPAAVITGLLCGVLLGLALVFLFKRIHMRDTVKVLLILGIAFLLVTLESVIKDYLPLSGLLAVMALGSAVFKRHDVLAKRLSEKFSKLWIAAELILFVLVGATVDIRYAGKAGLAAAALILGALAIRICGVFVCLIRTKLRVRERLFCAIAYLPKATVQAAIGGLPLASGAASGHTVLTVAVLAILITAPLGAVGIDAAYQKLLSKESTGT